MRKQPLFVIAILGAAIALAAAPHAAHAKNEDRVIARGNIQLPIGPIGIRSIMTSVTTAKVSTIEKGSPADGKLQLDDVIVGANGKKFASQIWREMGQAVEASQGDPKRKGVFTLEIVRKERALSIAMKIEPLGRFGPTYPFDCTKSDRIYAMACDYLARLQKADGSWPHLTTGTAGRVYAAAITGMALLGSGDPKYNDHIRKVAAFLLKQDIERRGASM